MSWSQPPDPNQPPPRPSDPNWVQVPPDQWPGSTPPPSGSIPPSGSGYPQQTPLQTNFTTQPGVYQSPYPYVGPKRRGCGCSTLGCLIALVVIVAVVVPIVAVIGSFGAFSGGDFMSQINEMISTIGDPTGALGLSTTALPGDATAYDPFAALEDVTAFAGDGALLAEITAAQVRSDGTQNLNAEYDPPRPNTDYEFYREVARPENAPPVGAGGTTDGQWYEPVTVSAYRPGQMSQISRTGGSVNIQTQFVNQGLRRQTQDPTTNLAFIDGFVGAPACTTRQLWSLALEEGAPADAVATITYNSEGYTFNIPGAGVFLNFDANCKPQS